MGCCVLRGGCWDYEMGLWNGIMKWDYEIDSDEMEKIPENSRIVKRTIRFVHLWLIPSMGHGIHGIHGICGLLETIGTMLGKSIATVGTFKILHMILV